MKKLLPALSLFSAIFVPRVSLACFDTYLFLQRSSMVYPTSQLVVDGGGEYTVNDVSATQADSLAGGINAYYGIRSRFSIQVGVGSGDKPRGEVGIDEYGLRAVGNVFRNAGGFYNLDVILEHTGSFTDPAANFEISAPNIFYTKNLAIIAHPVVAVGPDEPAGVRGHGGVFYLAGDTGVIGVGGEYASNQSSSNLGNRLIEGEAGTSLFLGARIGDRVYIQDELIKGWGADTKDYGMALTIKVGVAGVHEHTATTGG